MVVSKTHLLTWVEISRPNLLANMRSFRRLVGKNVILAPCVKGNAYGHGLIEVSKIISKAGADWLCVNDLIEAEALRKAGIDSPIYILGYVMNADLPRAIELDCRLVVYNKGTVDAIAKAAAKLRKQARIHIKVETGCNRQGVVMEELLDFVLFIKKFPDIELEGISTHFANIEDTVDPEYAKCQLKNFEDSVAEVKKMGLRIPIRHCANSSGTMLFPRMHLEMVRPGCAIYGLWPSKQIEKRVTENGTKMDLKPVLSWKTRVVQIKDVQKGAYIGYGCTYKTKRATRIAVLPVGYYDGYDRHFSNSGYVLIGGKRANVCGRVCMNMIVVDITDIKGVQVEDVATLIGKDGREEITADHLANILGTINYEVVTRIGERIPRVVV